MGLPPMGPSPLYLRVLSGCLDGWRVVFTWPCAGLHKSAQTIPSFAAKPLELSELHPAS